MMHLRIWRAILLCVLLTTAFFPSNGQKKESEIVSKFRTALGRCAEDIPEPPTILKGTIRMAKIAFDGVIHYHKPHYRMDLSMQGFTFIAYQNDTVSWSYDPTKDRHEVKARPKDEAERDQQRELKFDFVSKDLLNYRKRGHKLTFAGVARLDSLEVNRLELTKADGSRIEFYLSTRTNLIYKIQADEGYRFYANYSRYGDCVYPSLMYTDVNGDQMEIVMREIAIDVPIPDSLFTIPQIAFDQINRHRQHIKSLLASGDSLYRQKDFAGAINAYTEVLLNDEKNYLAYNGRGLSKVQQQKYYEAISDFNVALEIAPGASSALNNRGLAKFYLGDNKGALEDYDSAVGADSTLAMAYRNRGLIHLRSKQYAKAADNFSKAVKLNADDGDSHFKYGVAIAQLERYNEAIASYDKALALNYRTAEVYNYYGVSQFKLEKYDSAGVLFKKALNLDVDNLQYLENYGNALYRLQNYNSAMEQFERYKKLKDDNAEIHNLIGLCKYHDEDYHGAIRDFTRSIELNPKGAVYFDNRAAAKEQIEDYEGAINDYTQSIAIYPNDARIFYKRGLIKIYTSKKMEGCMDLGTANEMKYDPAKDAIMKNCH